jgi:hypothetical protein
MRQTQLSRMRTVCVAHQYVKSDLCLKPRLARPVHAHAPQRETQKQRVQHQLRGRLRRAKHRNLETGKSRKWAMGKAK